MDSLEQLQARRRAASERDQLSGFIVGGVVDFSERMLGAAVTGELREGAKLPKRIVPFLKYGMPEFLDFAEALVRARLAQGQPLQEALESVGRAGTEAFLSNPLGQMMLSLNGGNVHRMLARTPTIYSSVYTFGERRYTRTSDRSAVIDYDDDLMGPAIQAGVVKIAMQKSCDTVVTVKARAVEREGRRYGLEIAW